MSNKNDQIKIFEKKINNESGIKNNIFYYFPRIINQSKLRTTTNLGCIRDCLVDVIILSSWFYNASQSVA